MSGSETGLTAVNREPPMPFPLALHHQHNQPQPPPQQQHSQNMQLSFTGADRTAVYKPMSSESSPQQQQQHYQHDSGLNMNIPVTTEQRVKKRRGRPRRYGPESSGGGGEASLGFAPGPPSFAVSQPTGGEGGSGGGGGGASPTVKRMRGRPSGSSNRQKLQALGNKFI